MTKKLETSTLIQQVEKSNFPVAASENQFLNPHSFGGGLKNGGLNEVVARQLATVIQWKYMGAAEYEHGALIEGFKKLFSKDEIVLFSFDYHFAKKGTSCTCHLPEGCILHDDVDGTVSPTRIWTISHGKIDVGELHDRVKAILLAPDRYVRGYDDQVYLKDAINYAWQDYRDATDPLSNMPDHLRPHRNKTVGGFELNNGIWIFWEEETARRLYELMKPMQSAYSEFLRQNINNTVGEQ